MKTKSELAQKLAEYILNDDREYFDYKEWCKENEVNPAKKNDTRHIYGVAMEFLDKTGTEIK